MTPYGFGPGDTGFTDNGRSFGMNIGMGTGFPGNCQSGFGGGMGFPGNFPPGYGMPFPGYYGPGMGYQAGYQPGFGPAYPWTFQPGFNMMPGMGSGFPGPFPWGVAQAAGPCAAQDYTMAHMMNPTPFMPEPMQMGWGLGGGRLWGGTYSPQYMMTGLPTDDEVVEIVYDSIDNDPLIPYDAEINVESDAGTVTLTGTVTTKQIKHAAGDDAWWIPGVDDVCNELSVERRRPAHAAREPGAETRRQTRGTTETGTEAQAQPFETNPTPRAARRGATRR